MSSNYAPVAGNIQVIDHLSSIAKMPLPTSARSFPAGSPMWNNGADGVEPALLSPGEASVEAANAVFAAYFAGIAATARVPQQLAAVNEFSAPGDATAATDDASQPFLSVYMEGVALGPCDALSGQHEIGELVDLAGFTNEASTGFYDPSGALIKDTNKYLYNNKVQITTEHSHAIGVLIERAVAGQTFLKFRFSTAAFSYAQSEG